MFTTERLTLRGYRDSDAEHFMSLASDVRTLPGVTCAYISPPTSKHIEKIRGWVESSLTTWIIETRSFVDVKSEWVGAIFINPGENLPKNREGKIGIHLLYEQCGKGYGTEAMEFAIDHAFRWLGLHRLTLDVFEHNERAKKLYHKLRVVFDL